MKAIFKRIGQWLARHWRGLVYLIIVIALATLTLSLQLNSLVGGQSHYETQTLTNLQTFPKPWQRVANAPYMVPAYLIGKAIGNPLLGARITSVIFCLLAAACFFFIVKFWFKTRIASVGTLLFLTSSWLLNISHQATPLSWMVLAPLLIIMTLTWYLKAKEHNMLAFYGLATSLALAAYIPYAFWIIAVTLAVLIIKGKHKLSVLKTRHIFMAAIIYFVLLFLLFFSLASHPGQIRELLGIPTQLPGLGTYFSQLMGLFSLLFIYSDVLPELHIGHLPLLDIFSGVMFLLGLYYFIRRLPRRSSLIFLASLAILFVVLPISPDYQMMAAILLPSIYLAVISGITKLLGYWFEYFPRNPLIRNLGVVLVVIAIGFSCYYHLQNYYIAWPSSPETKASYSSYTLQTPASPSQN
jgi:hypothetical protein